MVRAKFRCKSVTQHEYANSGRTFVFYPVGADEVEENRRFHKMTPSGELTIYVDNPAVQFELGKAYYLDFTPAG